MDSSPKQVPPQTLERGSGESRRSQDTTISSPSSSPPLSSSSPPLHDIRSSSPPGLSLRSKEVPVSLLPNGSVESLRVVFAANGGRSGTASSSAAAELLGGVVGNGVGAAGGLPRPSNGIIVSGGGSTYSNNNNNNNNSNNHVVVVSKQQGSPPVNQGCSPLPLQGVSSLSCTPTRTPSPDFYSSISSSYNKSDVSSSRAPVARLMDILLKIVATMMLATYVVFLVFGGSSDSAGNDSPDNLSSLITPYEKPRVLVISASQSGCGTEKGDNDILKSLKNKVDYARRHGMDTWFSMELLVDPQFHRLRNKIVLLKQVMQTQTNYDWYVWIDSDALFTDMSFEIPWARYAGKSIVVFGSEQSVDTNPDYHESINMGVAYFRNDAFTRAFLNYMTEFWDKNSNQTELTERVKSRIKRLPGYVCDQGTVLYLLLTEGKRWRPGFFFELTYGMNRYWKEEGFRMESYVEGDGESWKGDGLSPPFITHFCGCALCWKKLAEDFDECQLQYERTYHFADNQIIRALGVKHRNLSSPEVVKLTEEDLHPRSQSSSQKKEETVALRKVGEEEDERGGGGGGGGVFS